MSGHSRDQLFTRLCDFLTERGVEFCVMGDTSCYPLEIDSDVDIAIGRPWFKNLEALLLEYCAEQRLSLLQQLQHEVTAKYFVLAAPGELGKPVFLMPDVCTDYLRNGRRFLTAEQLLADRRESGLGFPVAAPATELIYYLIKKVDKGGLNDRQGHHLHCKWAEDPDGSLTYLRQFWSEQEASMLAQALQTDSWDNVRAALSDLRASLRRSAVRCHLWSEFRRRVHRVLCPAGISVAFLGPDGSGKSTAIEYVREAFSPAFRGVRYYHLRPRVLGGQGTGGTVTDPHAQPPRSKALSVAKLFYFLADFALGSLTQVWPDRCRSRLVLFDRYYHDIMVDPRRFRYSGPSWLAAVVGRFVSQPDVWILMVAPPEVLQSRKQEVSGGESARQSQAYQDLARSLPKTLLIDSSGHLNEMKEQLQTELLSVLATRFHARYGRGLCFQNDSSPRNITVGSRS